MPDTVVCSVNRVIIDYYIHNNRTGNDHLLIIFSAQFLAMRMLLIRLSPLSKTRFPLYLLLLNISKEILAKTIDKKDKRYSINWRERKLLFTDNEIVSEDNQR